MLRQLNSVPQPQVNDSQIPFTGDPMSTLKTQIESLVRQQLNEQKDDDEEEWLQLEGKRRQLLDDTKLEQEHPIDRSNVMKYGKEPSELQKEVEQLDDDGDYKDSKMSKS